MSDREDLSGYVIREAPRSLESTLPKRRTRFSTWPLWKGPGAAERCEALLDDLFERVGLTEYIGCSSYEYIRRPLLAIRPPEASTKLIEVCKKWIPLIMTRAKRTLRVPSFALDKRSKLGSPVRKRVDNKLEVCTPFFEQFLAGDWSSVEQDGVALQGIRLQWERRSKDRSYVFAKRDLRPEAVTVDAAMRAVDSDRLCSRTRMIVNPALLNLAKQPCDTSIHHALLEWRCCQPNLDVARRVGFNADVLRSPDWTHFDHQAGYMARMYAAAIGGEYQRACELIWSKPVVCRVDGWRDVCYLTARPGYLQQFWSGDSSVAPFGKFVCLATHCEFIAWYFHLEDEAVLDAMQNGQCGEYGFRNYGDDNIVFGSKTVIDAYEKHIRAYVDLDFEDPPRFLGDVYTKRVDGRWRSNLDWRSYFLNWWLAERAPYTVFRPKPCFGWLARRRDYANAGPANMQQLLAIEDAVLAEHGADMDALHQAAAKEAVGESLTGFRMQHEKAHLLSDDEKARLPEYNVVPRELVERMIRYFFPKDWSVSA